MFMKRFLGCFLRSCRSWLKMRVRLPICFLKYSICCFGRIHICMFLCFFRRSCMSWLRMIQGYVANMFSLMISEVFVEVVKMSDMLFIHFFDLLWVDSGWDKVMLPILFAESHIVNSHVCNIAPTCLFQETHF